MKKSGSNGEEIVTIGSTTGNFSGSFTGSLQGTASWAFNAITASYALNAGSGGGGADITGSQYYVAVFNSTSSLVTGSIYDSASVKFTAIGATTPVDPENPDRLFIDAGDTTSYNLLSGHGTIDNYLQLNVQNFSSAATASSDIVATADNGGEDDYYVNMGINGSGYNDSTGVGASNDAYLFNTGGDLLIGNASTNKRVIIFNGGTPALDNARVYITQEGTVGINASDASLINPEALLVEPLSGSATNTFNNLIIGRGTIHESYLQLNITNKGTGSAASSDIVATNDIGNETSYYIDMGVNSSGYNTPNAVGTASDAYVYSTARHLHIGNASNYPIQFFAGGLDSDANRKLQLNPNGLHELTGSLSATQGFTGSLFGTASFSTNTLTASYVNPLVQDVQITGSLSITGSTGISGSTLVLQRDSAPTSSLITAIDNLGRLLFHVRGAYEITPGGNPTAASIYIGYNSGQYVTASSSNRNTSLGGLTLSSLTTGGKNVAVGQYALQSLLTGNFNTAIGERAAPAMTSGEDNTIVGNGAGAYRLSGSFNVAVGSNALERYAGNNNTAVGVLAGRFSSGDYNVFIGRNAGANVVTGSYNVVIGGNNGASLNTLNNYMLFSDGQGNERFRVTNTGEFLIGTTTTGSYKFQVNGTSNFLNNVTVTGSVTATQGFTGSLQGTASWALNTLTASYADNFTVAGTLTAQTIIVQTITSSTDFVTGSTRFGSLLSNTHQFTGSVSMTGSLTATGISNITASQALTASYVNPLRQDVIITGSLFVSSSNATQLQVGSNLLFITGSGNIGIGTTSILSGGSTTLDIVGRNDSFGGTLYLRNLSSTARGYVAMYDNTAGLGVGTETNHNFTISTNGSTRAAVFANGNVGIGVGTTDSGYKLDVNGTARTGIATINGYETNGAGYTGFRADIASTITGTRNIILGNGAAKFSTAINDNIVIGHQAAWGNPQGIVAIGTYAGNSASGTNIVAIGKESLYSAGGSNNIGIGDSAGRYIGPSGTTSNTLGSDSIFIGVSTRPDADNQANQIVIGHQTIGNGANSVTLGNTSITKTILRGSVGIGTTSPNARLDVSGSAIISGSLSISSSLYSSLGATGSAATTTTIVSVPTGSYTAGFFDYTVSSGSNSRAGTVMSVWNGNNVQYTDNSTLDIGTTNDVTMSVALSGGNILLRSTTTAFQWIIKTTYRLI